MSTAFLVVIIILGLVLLQQGASCFISGSTGLARRFRVPDITIGLTIVAFGTSAPELFVNVIAAAEENHDIVMGNILGSNSFNLFIILSIAGIIAPLRVSSNTAWKEIPFSFLVLAVLFLLVNDSIIFARGPAVLSRIDGLILLFCLGLFLFYVFIQLRREQPVASRVPHKSTPPGLIIFWLVIGLGGLILGGQLVLKNAVELATKLGMSERMIGLTIVAAGTSLPELATSVTAALKKNYDIAVGNIIGSNIFNIVFILGLSSLIKPLEYNPAFNRDIALIAGGTMILFLAMYTGKKKEIDRWEAFVLLAAYTVYFVLAN